jgi:L-asparaginase
MDTDSLQDTPTIGAGFWAEQWIEENPFDRPSGMLYQQPTLSPAARLVNGDFSSVLQECLPSFSAYLPLSSKEDDTSNQPVEPFSAPHGVALSGTGIITHVLLISSSWLITFR